MQTGEADSWTQADKFTLLRVSKKAGVRYSPPNVRITKDMDLGLTEDTNMWNTDKQELAV